MIGPLKIGSKNKKGVVVLTGATSGLGEQVCSHMLADGWIIYPWSLERGIDIRDTNQIIREIDGLPDKVDILINCAGINYIQYIPDMPDEMWDMVMDTNTKSIYSITKYMLPKLRDGTILNIVSNASHVPMTCSIAYNASKAAAAIMTKQMARELGKTHNITVFAISPNKLSGTGMSDYIDKRVLELRGWTPEQAKAYQLQSLPAGEETNPGVLAEFIAFLLHSKLRHKYLQGCDIPYGGP